jgi:hypothetical protein
MVHVDPDDFAAAQEKTLSLVLVRSVKAGSWAWQSSSLQIQVLTNTRKEGRCIC